jgi:tetratricopeptide (TPR) repeat protein
MFPGNKDLFYYLALMYSADGEKEQEIEVYTELLDNFPDEYKALMNRALLYNDLQKFEEAVADLSMAIQIDPEDPEPRVLRGVIFIDSGKTDQGCIDLKRAYELGDKSAAVIELIPMHCED